MSWTSFPALADSPSASNEPECVPSPSARSSLSPVPSSPSIGPMSPATTTFTTLQQTDWLATELGESTSSVEAIPASPSPTPGSKEATKILAISGRRCAELLAKSDPLGCLLKMLLVTSPWASTKCLLTWKPTATPGGRLLFRLVPKTLRTSDSDSGSWLATATATANQLCPSMQKWKGCREIWPTPTSRDWKDGTAEACRNVPANGLLGREVHLWGTPNSHPRTFTPRQQTRPNDEKYQLANQVGGSLNPAWVEWLMGFPPGWTDLKPSEMPSSRRSSKKLDAQ